MKWPNKNLKCENREFEVITCCVCVFLHSIHIQCYVLQEVRFEQTSGKYHAPLIGYPGLPARWHSYLLDVFMNRSRYIIYWRLFVPNTHNLIILRRRFVFVDRRSPIPNTKGVFVVMCICSWHVSPPWWQMCAVPLKARANINYRTKRICWLETRNQCDWSGWGFYQ